MEIAKALWQLSYAMLIFAGYLLFMIFVAPFGFGFAALVSAWNSFRGRSHLSAAVAVFTGIFLEVFGFGIWIAHAAIHSWRSASMVVSLKLSALKEGRWYEHVIRFALGGLTTLVAGIIADIWGSAVGGLTERSVAGPRRHLMPW